MCLVQRDFKTKRIEENDSRFRTRSSPARCGIGGVLAALIVFAFNPVLAQTTIPSKEVGPKVGQKIPAFKASDQFGHQQTLSSLMGPKGLVLLFVRSADW
jgi:hypothetical protein